MTQREPASERELRQLAARRAAGFEDVTLSELRYDEMVQQDQEELRQAARRNHRPTTEN